MRYRILKPGGGRNILAAFFLGLAGGLSLLVAEAKSAPAQDTPGKKFSLSIQDLPAPFATPAVSNPPYGVAPPSLKEGAGDGANEGAGGLHAPEGFRINVFAEGLNYPRWLESAPNGDVFLAEPKTGRVLILRDTDKDGRADLIAPFAAGLSRPHGLALQGDWLYVADTKRVWRYPYVAGKIKPAGGSEAVTGDGAIGGGAGHWTRNIAFHPDGTRFYVAIGSRGNIAEETLPRASVQEFSRSGEKLGTLAYGLRNPVGISFYPGTEDLYVTVNERDGLGDGLVPDYLTRLQRGGFYGWPYAYLGPNKQPGWAEKNPALVEKTILPDLLFRAHSAPLGLVFYNHTQFPEEYRGDAFVALHGSWNASAPQGYMVVRVPFAQGRPKGFYESFVSGFWARGKDRAGVIGRPAGLSVTPDGALLIADDEGGKIWRISYEGETSGGKTGEGKTGE